MTSTGPIKAAPSGAMAGALSPPNTNFTLERDRELVIEKNKQWQRELLMERIRSRSAQQRPFSELARVLRWSMLDKRQNMDTVERANLVQALDQMQDSVRTNTREGLADRLKSLSRQLGLKFMAEGDSLYIASDMFYLDIIVLKDGTLVDAKVHHECISKLVPCKALFDCLLAGDFVDFTAQLVGLTQIYQLNAEPKVKTKAYVALQGMEQDIETIYNSQQLQGSSVTEMLAESKVGLVLKRRGGHAMKLAYFIAPYDLLAVEEEGETGGLTLDMLAKQQIGNFATLNLEASSANKLQTTPIVSVNAEASGKSVVYAQLNANNSMMLPATFVLRLNKPIPVCFVALRALGLGITALALERGDSDNNGNAMETFDAESNGSISLDFSDLDDAPVEDIQMNLENALANNNVAAIASTSVGVVSASATEDRNAVKVDYLMQLIVQTASEQQLRNGDRGMFLTLPDQTHCYFFTDTNHLQGTLLQSLPFTEPSQVPAIMQFLKEQSLFYTLLSSCVRPNAKINYDMENTNNIEVGAKSLMQIHVTLQNPYDECMVDLELKLDGGNVTAHIYSYLETFEELSAKVSKIVQSSLSIPVTVRSLLKYWEKEQMKQFQSNTGGMQSLRQSSTSPLQKSNFGMDAKNCNPVSNVAGLSLSNSRSASLNQTVSSSTSEGSLNSMSATIEVRERALWAPHK